MSHRLPDAGAAPSSVAKVKQKKNYFPFKTILVHVTLPLMLMISMWFSTSEGNTLSVVYIFSKFNMAKVKITYYLQMVAAHLGADVLFGVKNSRIIPTHCKASPCKKGVKTVIFYALFL
ncbi:hypothetical protein XELAEV_18009352mg [Xenopus laevis]|uniref:Uncharacterized protein n=1 Tax=Xenopus laevis TaxID=8355 RepID=A0A974I0H2_XENLA|nr:hypothetical protein XELAEV_18009352mg [Xenopus laevis]